MSSTTRPANTSGTYSYGLHEFGVAPIGIPQRTIYSDAARTVVAAASAAAVATGDPFSFIGSYPSSLGPGTYYLKHVTEMTAGNFFTDINDQLVLEAVSGSVADGLVCTVWTTSDKVLACDEAATGDLSDAIRIASDVLYVLSGRQFPGTCSATIRPCNACSCSCHSDSVFGGSCCSPPRILLGDNIQAITQVREDGLVLAAENYRLDASRWLTRMEVDGQNDGWRCGQRLDLDATEEETFEVSFTFGSAPPPMGVRAASVLAAELQKSCLGQECRLPSRVTTVTRQGLTVVLDSFDFLDDGKVGIYEVDLFLGAHNPGGIRQRATMVSPDSPRNLRT